ncbi:hypothetical protein M413DRAFT_449187 [Hebeloma cylindrosporum]|uniref:Uncharacterized protein n=1 Tax=Hebeloma cylindrosporum TaxID=76867 RepID=A0A0C2XEG2_HEBCY|nr:hypothetical protein M413DRAFT_449187 [Hebeloma cylindrosporum h7]
MKTTHGGAKLLTPNTKLAQAVFIQNFQTSYVDNELLEELYRVDLVSYCAHFEPLNQFPIPQVFAWLEQQRHPRSSKTVFQHHMRSFDTWIASKLPTSSSKLLLAAVTLPTFGQSARIACAIVKAEGNLLDHDLGSLLAVFWDEIPDPGYLSLVSQFWWTFKELVLYMLERLNILTSQVISGNICIIRTSIWFDSLGTCYFTPAAREILENLP